VEQNRGPGYKSMQTMVPKTYNGEKTGSSTNVGESGYLPAEN
jgi:hypothetical protein